MSTNIMRRFVTWQKAINAHRNALEARARRARIMEGHDAILASRKAHTSNDTLSLRLAQEWVQAEMDAAGITMVENAWKCKQPFPINRGCHEVAIS